MSCTIAELEALQPDWNSYGAPVIDPRAIAIARELIGQPAQLIPTNRGGVMLSWSAGSPSQEYSLTIAPDGEQEFE